MADPYVREVGTLDDYGEQKIAVGVDYDTVTLGTPGQYSAYVWRFDQHQAEEFAQLFVSACWQAGANARQMAQESWDTVHPVHPDGGDTMAEPLAEVKSSPSDDLENPGRVEYGLLMSGGGFHVRSESLAVERIYPAQQWMKAEVRAGGHVYRRRIVVTSDWEEWIIPRDTMAEPNPVVPGCQDPMCGGECDG